MRICVASEGPGGLEDGVSSVFGRCSRFTIVEIEDGEIKNVHVVENPGAQASGGAGIQAAQKVIDEGCSVIIASSIGPNAGEVFRMANIKMLAAPGMIIKEAIQRYLNGELQEIVPHGGKGGGRGMGRGRGMGMGRTQVW